MTSQGAVDTELGVLKTGKEADVHLVERADPFAPANGVVMAAKRYRSPEHRSFHRAASYTEGRSMKRSRDERAIKRKSTFGRLVAAGEWAVSEWGALVRLWNLGLPVPYPVQIDGTEIMMEWITVLDEEGAVQTAPRLAQTRPRPSSAAYFEQLTDALAIDGAERRRPRRPVGVQHPGARATDWSSSTCRRSSTWSATSTAWTSSSATAPTSARGSSPGDSRSTSTHCSGAMAQPRSSTRFTAVAPGEDGWRARSTSRFRGR